MSYSLRNIGNRFRKITMCFTFSLYFMIYELHAATAIEEDTTEQRLTGEDFYTNIARPGLLQEVADAPSPLSRRKSYQSLVRLCKDRNADLPIAGLHSPGDASKLINGAYDKAWQVFSEITDFLYENSSTLFPDGILPAQFTFAIPGDAAPALTTLQAKKITLEYIFARTIREDHDSRGLLLSHCKAFYEQRESTTRANISTIVNQLYHLTNVNNALLASLPSIAGCDNDIVRKYLNSETHNK